MILSEIRTERGTYTNLYKSWDEYYAEAFCPDVTILTTLALEITGRTYAERKASARELAIMYQSIGDTEIQLSYGELSEIQSFFEQIGRKFGLLKEYRENAIC